MKNDRLSVVIVTFNNADMLEKLLCELQNQIRLPDEIIVVDNASQDRTESLMQTRSHQITYVRLSENQGSAGGYFEGIKRATESSDFIYTLDDDVCLWPETLSNIIDGFYRLTNILATPIGAVRSVWQGFAEKAPKELDICPWRGTLFKTTAVQDAGLPCPEFFIYGEDLEYSLRLKKKGYHFYWIPESLCQERRRPQDGKSRTSIFGKTYVRYQEPFRLYYAFRNEVFIWRKYRCTFRLAHTMMYAAKVFLMILMTEGLRGFKTTYAVAQGIKDGFHDRLGKNIYYCPTGVRPKFH